MEKNIEKDVSKVEDSLKQLVSKMKEQDTVTTILIAKNSAEKYIEEKEKLKKDLETFERAMEPFIKCETQPYEKVPKYINSNNIIDVCLILIMTRCVDDVDFVLETRGLNKILSNVKGKYEVIAEKMKKFLYDGVGSGFFTDYEEEEILKIIL